MTRIVTTTSVTPIIVVMAAFLLAGCFVDSRSRRSMRA